MNNIQQKKTSFDQYLIDCIEIIRQENLNSESVSNNQYENKKKTIAQINLEHLQSNGLLPQEGVLEFIRDDTLQKKYSVLYHHLKSNNPSFLYCEKIKKYKKISFKNRKEFITPFYHGLSDVIDELDISDLDTKLIAQHSPKSLYKIGGYPYAPSKKTKNSFLLLQLPLYDKGVIKKYLNFYISQKKLYLRDFSAVKVEIEHPKMMIENILLTHDLSDFPQKKKHQGIFEINKANMDNSVREKLSHLAHEIYPSSINNIIGVTGTYGKTSTVSFIRQMLLNLEFSAATMGSEGVYINKNKIKNYPDFLTTPSPLFLHYYLNTISLYKPSYFAMEVTSHSLDRHRVDDIPYKVGVFTNLNKSHLNYHKTIENYFTAKKRFFSEVLAPESVAVVNSLGEWHKDILSIIKNRNMQNIIIGKDITLKKVDMHHCDTNVIISYFGEEKSFILPGFSCYQIENILHAIGSLTALNFKWDEIKKSLLNIDMPPGRMELVAILANNSKIYVDYAHRPETFTKILKPLYEEKKETIFVFGCGGGTSDDLRSSLAEIANLYASKIFITDDNPRKENPKKIRDVIKKSCPRGIVIPDRKEAIEKAIASLKENGICIISGRGNETVQVIKNKKILFNDKTEILRIIKNDRVK